MVKSIITQPKIKSSKKNTKSIKRKEVESDIKKNYKQYDEFLPKHPMRYKVYKIIFDTLTKYNDEYGYEYDIESIQKIVINIEKSIFNKSIGINKHWNWRFEDIYKSNAVRVYSNLDPSRYVHNTELIHMLFKKEIEPIDIVGLNPEQIFPTRYKYLFDSCNKEQLIPKIQPDERYDGFFKCPQCKSMKTEYVELQIRGGDEISTKKAYCHKCENRWTFE